MCLAGVTGLADAQSLEAGGRIGGAAASQTDTPPPSPELAALDAPQAPRPPSLENPHTGFKTLFKDVLQDFKHLPSRDSALWLGVTGGLAGLSVPIDDDLNERLAGSGAADAFFAPGKVLGYGAVQIGASIGTWVVGRVTNKRGRVAHLGLDLLRAQIVTQSLTYGLKYATRRERPDGSDGYSFPSGHASTTFASATVLERHLGWKFAVPTYAVATYVAASRLHENRHYMSDVVFGAGVGLIAGRTVTRHGRSNYAFLPVVVPGGVALQVARIG
jgi:membrane-associated phospholipid phosphatase